MRAAIEEKLAILRDEAKERVTAVVIEKAEELKECMKEKIKHKIEEVLEHHQNGGDAGTAATFHRRAAPSFRHAAKDAVKRVVNEHRRNGGGLLSKLAQLRGR